jgi:hypothetical protein
MQPVGAWFLGRGGVTRWRLNGNEIPDRENSISSPGGRSRERAAGPDAIAEFEPLIWVVLSTCSRFWPGCHQGRGRSATRLPGR